MPWAKTFNIDKTLDNAMRMFWSRGYEATSIQDLVQGMGINRGSLYDTYGHKRSLFIAALQHYDKQYRKTRLARLEREHSPKRAIEALFVDWIDLVTTDADRRGCLLTNTALELSAHDAEIGAIVATSQKETEQFFRRLIKRGQAIGEIDQGLDATQNARLLLAALIGLLVLARSRPERTLLKSIASSAMGPLE